jgi:hypothetical protein
MIHKTFLRLLLIGLAICVAFVPTDEVMAQEDPFEPCEIVVPDKKGDITFTIQAVPNADGQWPYQVEACDPEVPVEPCCPDNISECLAAPYNISSEQKFNEVWLSFPVDTAQFEFLGLNAQPSGYTFYAPCDEGSPLRSCFDSQIQVSFQTIPSGETQRLVLFFGLSSEPGAILKTGTGEFWGGYGRSHIPCQDGIIVPSTEEGCFVRETTERAAKAEIEQFQLVTIRVWRTPDGCVIKDGIDVCRQPNPDDPNDCLVDWLSASLPPGHLNKLLPEETGPKVKNTPIKDCGNTIAPVGYQTPCPDECKLVEKQNPGWIWYNIYGSWYKICGGVSLNCGCYDPDTQQCCSYGGFCTDCTTTPCN